MKTFAALILVLSLLVVSFSTVSHADTDKVYKKLETLSKVLSFVEANYIEEVDTNKILDDAIKGLLKGLDPHTMYMSPEVFREMRVDTRGAFGGLGIEVSMKDNQLLIVAPLEDTPADRAGIQPKDVITKIGNKSTRGITLLEAVKLLRGPRGSSVTLTLVREGEKEPLIVTLKRETIRIKSVSWEFLEDGYGYIRMKNFQEKTVRELTRALEKMDKEGKSQKKPMKGLVLDLRNNPGGLLDQATRAADIFLESGVIVSTIGRKGAFQEVEMAHKDGTSFTRPMIVLVNEGTASAAEILAGALQDHERAVVLGTPTFGKGSVQTIIELGDGSGLKLTIARYYTPKGRSIQALGIQPDIEVANVLPPVVEGAEYLREKDLKGHFEADQPKNVPGKQQKEVVKQRTSKKSPGETRLDGDIQLRRALEYLKTWEVFRSTFESKISKG